MEKVFKGNPESDIYIRELVNNVALLADYAEDLKLCLDTVAKARKLLLGFRSGDYDAILELDIPRDKFDETRMQTLLFNRLVDIEIELTKCLSDHNCNEVTIDTLRATRSGQGNRYLWTPTGRYLMFLWVVLMLMILLAMYFDYEISAYKQEYQPGDYEQQIYKYIYFLQYLNPFVFGTLGACTYLMRITSVRLNDRTFDPSRLPEHINRLLLGTVSGGIIILFIEDSISLGKPGEGIAMSSAAIGFVAGYSIEFLYQIIDRIIKAILPSINAEYVAQGFNKKKSEYLIKQCQRKLDEELVKDPKNKELISWLEKVIMDLKS